MQSSCKTHSEEPTSLRWAYSDFHVPFYWGLSKTTQCGGIKTGPRYPTCQVVLFRTAVAVVFLWSDFLNRRPNFSLLHHLFMDKLRTSLNFWKVGSRTIDCSLLFGGCTGRWLPGSLKGIKLWTRCCALIWQHFGHSFNSPFSISCLTVLHLFGLQTIR